MAVPVAAIVKRVAVAILGADKETKKGIGAAIGTLIVAPFVPILVIVGALTGMDTDTVNSNAFSRINTNIGAYISVVDTNLESIQSTMSDSGFSEIDIKIARDIYTIYLLSYGDQTNFVSRYVACFSSGQTAEQLTSNLNSTFGTTIDQSKIEAVINSLSSTYIDSARFLDTSTKTNLDICIWAEMAYEQNWGYVWGTYGNVLTSSSLNSLKETYPQQVGARRFYEYIQSHYIGRRCVDCAGLIKSYMWYNFTSGKIIYESNSFSDGNTEAIFGRSPQTGTIDTIPDILGLGVYHKGHMGIYVGDGMVIEAMGTTYGMQKRPVEEGSWTHWFVIPGLTYVQEEAETEKTTEESEAAEPTEASQETTEEEVNTNE